jgi:SAM-dependent methyltransferase
VAMGWRDPLLPPGSLHSVGSPDFVAVGEEFYRYFIDICGLAPHARILDVGCGTGRMAKPLTRYLHSGSYEGIDIVAPSIKWCQTTYAARHPNFHFHFADIYNKAYNPAGQYRAAVYPFPFADASFDFVFLTSVFTHMLPPDVEHYLAEIARVLKSGGRCLITYFLLNTDSEQLIQVGLSYHHFRHELPGCRVEYADTPEAIVGYDESTIRGLYDKYHLHIAGPILYGRWCQRPGGLSWQDMIVASRRA